MQAWNQVKVKDTDSEHAGRAGMVQAVETVDGEQIVCVMLDETEDLHGGQVNFKATQLQVLG